MEYWEPLVGIAAFIGLIFWIRWLLKPDPEAVWPYRDGFLRPALLYIIPLFLVAFTLIGVMSFAKSLGTPQEFGLYVGGIPIYIMLAISFIGILRPLLGIPTPPFLVPRWIREQDRKLRRIKRAEREQRWQDPDVKKAEIRSSILGALVTVGIVVVGFVGYIAAEKFLL